MHLPIANIQNDVFTREAVNLCRCDYQDMSQEMSVIKMKQQFHPLIGAIYLQCGIPAQP